MRRFREPIVLLLCSLFLNAPAAAHGYIIGHLEITHPAIKVPWPGMNCSCAHLRIRNTGPQMEYLIDATIAAAAQVELFRVDEFGRGTTRTSRLPLPPGQSIDLHKGWCLFMTGVRTTLQADMGVVPGQLLFETAGAVHIEFMIDDR